MSDQSCDFIGHRQILVGHCPMTNCYLQPCVRPLCHQTKTIYIAVIVFRRLFLQSDAVLGNIFCGVAVFRAPPCPLENWIIAMHRPFLSLKNSMQLFCKEVACGTDSLAMYVFTFSMSVEASEIGRLLCLSFFYFPVYIFQLSALEHLI